MSQQPATPMPLPCKQRPDTYNYHRRFACGRPASFIVQVEGRLDIAVCTQHLAKMVREQAQHYGVDSVVVQILKATS